MSSHLAEGELDQSPPLSTEPSTKAPTGGLFRAFWRWHFYASAIVIPIMLLLSVTGLLMLFKWQIDPIQAPALTFDRPAYGAQKALSTQEAAALEAVPGATIGAVQMSAEDRSTFFTVTTADGQTRNVYVNPYTAQVLGTVDPDSLLSNIATQIHGMIIFGQIAQTTLFTDPVTGEDFTTGSIGDRVIELASCWAIVMALTGYYLYWRGRTGRLRRKASATAGAALRHRHSVIGAWVGGGILLLVVTGLPWTGLWGGKVQQWATGSSFSLWGEDPGATSTLGAKLDSIGSSSVPAPWAEGQAPLPRGTDDDMAGMPGMDHGAEAASPSGHVSIDKVVATAAADGLAMPYYIAYPTEEDGVFSVMSDMWHDKSSPAYSDVGLERVTHVDQYSGAVAGRYSYDEYAPAAQLVSQGIAIHEGQRFGSLNFWASAAFCVSVIVLCVTGPVMWWRRRPSGGGLAAPRGRMPFKAKPLLAVGVVLLGIFLPLFGASLLLVLIVDWLVVARSGRLQERLNRA